jgi:transposase
MASVDYWAAAPMQRQQMALFAPTLDEMIAADDPVRVVDEVLAGLDWSAWEAEYDGTRGQPPIHPRFVAAAILYGLSRGIRSTRKLEEACCYRLDFLWLVEGRRIDFTTFAKFRTRFGKQLKEVFRQLGRIAMTLGLVRLGEVAFDGTRVKANNSRYNTRTAATLAEKLAALDAQFDQMLAEWDAAEKQRTRDDQRFADAVAAAAGEARRAASAHSGRLGESPRAGRDSSPGRDQPGQESGPSADGRSGFAGDAEQGGRLRSELHAHGHHRRAPRLHRRLRSAERGE